MRAPPAPAGAAPAPNPAHKEPMRTILSLLALCVIVCAFFLLRPGDRLAEQPGAQPGEASVSIPGSIPVSVPGSTPDSTPGSMPGDQRGLASSDAVPLEIMAGQMVLAGFRGTGDEASEELDALCDDIAAGRLGGVIYFTVDAVTREPGRNIVSLEQAARLSAALQSKAPVPLFVGVDQEGGRVRRFTEEHGVPATPSARVLGWGDPEVTYAEAESLGALLARAGVNLNFAPSLDVDSNPDSPAIGALGRSFSADPAEVAAHGLAFARGMHKTGIIACYKHFPGHGSAAHDTHLGLVDITATWSEAELAPYREALPQSPPAMVMLGHMAHKDITGDLPASLSPAVVNMLRADLGWEGVIITDDMQMRAIEDAHSPEEAVRLAVEAGVDIVLLGNNLRHDALTARKTHAVLVELVTSGRVPEARIRASYERIMRLKREAGLL